MLILIVYNYLCVTRKGCSILVFQVEIQDVDIAVMKYWYPTIIKKKRGIDLIQIQQSVIY
jgi:hypothetical protein